MNPKIMKRPMFRMGGPARPNYQQILPIFKRIEDLIKKRAKLNQRRKQFDTIVDRLFLYLSCSLKWVT